MTQDEIMKLAKDAGLRIDVRGTYFFVGFGELSDLLDVAITKEREACAKVCDDLPALDSCSGSESSLWDVATLECGDAIRARSNT